MMTSIDRKLQFDHYLLGSIFLVLVGMFRMPVLMTIGFVFISGITVYGILKKYLYFQFDIVFIGAIIFYFWLTLTYFWSENTDYFLERLRIKLPILIVGVCGLWFQKIDINHFNRFSYLFVTLMIFSTLPSIVVYFSMKDYYDHQYLYGWTIPIPFLSHIRYGLMLVVAFQISLYLYFTFKNRIFIWAGLFLFVVINIFAVRSAIATLYISILVFIVFELFKTRNFKSTFIVTILLVLSILFSYNYVPSFRNKINYTKWGIQQLFIKGKSESSDEGSYISLVLGTECIKENFWFGCGEGDLKDEIAKKYQRLNEEGHSYEIKMPHNQFIWTWASSGVFGCLLLIGFLGTVFVKGIYKSNVWSIMFVLTAALSMTVEQTLETQLGVSFVMLPLLFFSKLKT